MNASSTLGPDRPAPAPGPGPGPEGSAATKEGPEAVPPAAVISAIKPGVMLPGMANVSETPEQEPAEAPVEAPVSSGVWAIRLLVTRPDMLRVAPTREEAETVDRHFAYLQELLARGVLLLAGRTLTTDFSTFGLALVRAPSEQAAREIMERDPVIVERVMRGELYPFRVALKAKDWD